MFFLLNNTYFLFSVHLEQEKLLRQVKALLDNTTASSDATELTNGTSVVAVYRVQSTSIKSESNATYNAYTHAQPP